MSDIVTRLWGNTGDKYLGFQNLNTEAAAEITRLREKIAAALDQLPAIAANANKLTAEATRLRAELAAWKAEAEAWRDVNESAQTVRKLTKQHGGGALVEAAMAQSQTALYRALKARAATDAIEKEKA